MTREIKFRTWDETRKKMIELCHPFYHDGVGGMLMYAIEPMEKYDNWDKKNPNLMQYTGLKDKNGKEIWEGDIIQVFTKELKEPAYIVTIRDMMKDQFVGVGNGEGEIIGNIYENPELIK